MTQELQGVVDVVILIQELLPQEPMFSMELQEVQQMAQGVPELLVHGPIHLQFQILQDQERFILQLMELL